MSALIFTLLIFLSHEEDYGGQFKHCVYMYHGERYVVTWPTYRPCKPSIEVGL